MLERFDKKYSLDEVFKFVNENQDFADNRKRVEFDGHMIKPYSVRYRTFIEKGHHCVSCGVEGSYFVKERHQSAKKKKYNDALPYHLNLYATTEDGEEVLMTKDHVIPYAKGGSNSVDNMVAMCTTCNFDKGTTLPDEWQKNNPKAEQLPKGTMQRHLQKLDMLVKMLKVFFLNFCRQLIIMLQQQKWV